MSATSRFRLEPAPGALTLVQDLVNTRPVPAYDVPDLLGTVQDARRFASSVLPGWREATGVGTPAGRLTLADVTALRRLRTEVVDAVQGRGRPRRVRAVLEVDDEGAVRLEPTGTGGRWWESAVWGSVLLARHDGTWDRLKTCRNRHCPCAFYDRSRNNSRVWHDVTTCGNVANLRASRARRRESLED